MDASNLLKPMLRAEASCTCIAPHAGRVHKHVEKDAALERRFQPVLWNQPSVGTPSHLARPAGSPTKVITACRTRTPRRWSRRRPDSPKPPRYIKPTLPADKAIDLMDERRAAAYRIDSRPAELRRAAAAHQCSSRSSASRSKGNRPGRPGASGQDREGTGRAAHGSRTPCKRAGRTRSRPWRGWAR